jgi:hypothetical protein
MASFITTLAHKISQIAPNPKLPDQKSQVRRPKMAKDDEFPHRLSPLN